MAHDEWNDSFLSEPFLSSLSCFFRIYLNFIEAASLFTPISLYFIDTTFLKTLTAPLTAFTHLEGCLTPFDKSQYQS